MTTETEALALLRPEVRVFAEAMERKLRENDYKSPWRESSIEYLLRRLHQEVMELELCFPLDQTKALDEAADVANFAMMLATQPIDALLAKTNAAPQASADPAGLSRPTTEVQPAAAPTERERVLKEALTTIEGGRTNRFPGAPDVMKAESPAEFQSAMWAWSQAVARAALAAKPPTREIFVHQHDTEICQHQLELVCKKCGWKN